MDAWVVRGSRAGKEGAGCLCAAWRWWDGGRSGGAFSARGFAMRWWGIAFLFAATAFAQSASDQGGGDVRVSLFTTHVVREVVLSSAGANAWTAKCERCGHVPLTGDVRVSAPAELFAGGRLRVRDVASGEERRAAGLWHLRARDAASGFDVVLTLPSERYVEAVVSAESGTADPAESLRAMAVLARTYALNGAHYK